jgi:hypothetical protein
MKTKTLKSAITKAKKPVVPSASHTPGPWRYERGFILAGEPLKIPGRTAHRCIGVLQLHGQLLSDLEANARLIAAAPGLLAECQRVLWLLENARIPGEITQTPEGIAQLRAAVVEALVSAPPVERLSDAEAIKLARRNCHAHFSDGRTIHFCGFFVTWQQLALAFTYQGLAYPDAERLAKSLQSA